MKFICTQENLHRGLQTVSHISGRNATLPILNNVLLRVKDGLIVLNATNLEIGVSAVIRGKIEDQGEFTIQAKLFADFISFLPRENVEVELKDDSFHISCGSQQTIIKGVGTSDFPLIPEIVREKPFVIKTNDLRMGLSQVMFAVMVDESRPEISGVFFSFNNNSLRIAGTDSYRLAEKRLPLQASGSAEEKKAIIPLRTLQELYRILSDNDAVEEVAIYLDDNQILFKYGETELISRLVEGQYPDYQQIIPTDQKTKALIKTSELSRIVKAASLFCKPGINDVKLTFLSAKNELIVSSINSAIGENLGRIEVKITGEDNEVVFNYRYLLDGLSNVGADEISLELVSESAPGILKKAGDDSYLYIIMPIRQ